MMLRRVLRGGVLLALALSFLNTGCSVAEKPVAKPDLVEVNANTKPRCVEYFLINGKQYCSLKPVINDAGGVEQNNYDRLQVVFDERSWRPAWGKNTSDMVTVEYVVQGDDIKNWRELVTSQFMPDPARRPSPPQYAANFIAHLKKQFPSIETKYLSQRPDEVVFEFKLKAPVEMAQHEIQRVFVNQRGLYVVHYVIKEPEMSAENREKWLSLLQKATPKE